MRRALLWLLFGKRNTGRRAGKEPWRGGVLNVLFGLVRSTFGSGGVLAIAAWFLFRREIESTTGTSGILAFFITAIGATIAAGMVAKIVRAINHGVYKVADVAERQIVEHEQTQAVLKEREGLLSAAHAPAGEDGSGLLRAAREDEQEPTTLLRQARPPE